MSTPIKRLLLSQQNVETDSSFCQILSQHPISTANIQLMQQDPFRMYINSDIINATWHVTVSTVSPLLSHLLLFQAISEPQLVLHLNIQQTEAHMHAHTQSPPVSCHFSHLLPTLTHT